MIERKYILPEFGGPVVFEILIPQFDSGMKATTGKMRGIKKKGVSIPTETASGKKDKLRSPIYSRPQKEWE